MSYVIYSPSRGFICYELKGVILEVEWTKVIPKAKRFFTERSAWNAAMNMNLSGDVQVVKIDTLHGA